ncbi:MULTISPECIES: hypothetical protein [Streptomyces]|uniref:Uncharacterized protein n=1 Tax=Streptomyces lonegramiae TaxID=3075524 RepID=A0ABU2XKV2_9ACTN|nr:hypothetical protein [Streptomyces sp. DSM 41529]MDT0546543.1 hypothetical protein [Streptomyces sp. DSM 41529]
MRVEAPSMRPAGVVLEESERSQWNFTPFVGVGPLRFGMDHDEVVAALGVDHASVSVPGRWATFHLPTSRGAALTAYYADGRRLHGIAVDALHGPQVTMDGLQLVGQVPSKLAVLFVDYVVSQGLREDVTWSQEGDPGADELGLVLRAQRAGDILLTRPVFVAREWANRASDNWEGPIPQEEWRVHA